MATEKGKSLESWIWAGACSVHGARDVGSRKKNCQLAKADYKLVRFFLARKR